MRNIVKFKLGLFSVSLFVMLFIYISRKNFFIDPVISKWRQLEWQDFQGFVKPFTIYDAAIHSDVYLEYDSVSKEMHAYAGQDITRSWTKSEREDQPALLRHEQYHFDLTEVFARMMNRYISQHPNEEYDQILEMIRYQHSRIQGRYDYESNHSTVIDQQRLWEYKIDSMLHEYSPNAGSTTDYYSGAKIFYSEAPEVKTGYTGGRASRSYTLRKYDMDFNLRVMDIGYGWQNTDLKDVLMKMFSSDTLDIVKFELNDTDSGFKGNIETFDTLTNLSAETHIQVQLPFAYFVDASYTAIDNKEDGYKKIQDSFLNSFEIVDTKDYWMSKNDIADSNIDHYNKEPVGNNDPEEGSCLVFAENGTYGFVGKTFFTEKGDLIIPYLPINQPDSTVMDYVVNIDYKMISVKPSGEDHFFHVPKEIIPENTFEVAFGHTLKKDSVEVCWQLYYHVLVYEKNN